MDVPEVSVLEAHARFDEFHRLDVRESHERRGPLGRVPGSTWIRLAELPRHATALPADRPILTVCRSGRRSAEACRILRQAGRDAVNLAGGLIAWNRAALPVERDRPDTLLELRERILAWLAQVRGLDRAAAEGLLRKLAGGGGVDPRRLRRTLDAIQDELSGREAPPDLDLARAVFLDWLTAF